MYAQTCKTCTAQQFEPCKRTPCTYRYKRVKRYTQTDKELEIIGTKVPSRWSNRSMTYLDLSELINLMCSQNFDALQPYLELGISINQIGFDEDQLILWACKYGCNKLVKMLLRHGANPRSRCSRHDMTAFYYAIKAGCLHVVKMLVDEGCNVNGLVKGHSYLFYAVEARQAQVAKCLIHYGADVNRRYFNGKTALQDACRLGHLEIVELLLAHGARVDCKTKRTLSPLAYAVISKKPDVVQALMRSGADVHEAVGTRCFLLHVAASSGSFESLCLFLNHGYDIDERTTLEETPLHLAVEGKNENVLNLLLNCGSNVNAINLKQQTPLHFAVEFDWPEAVCELLVKGADLSIRDRKNMTALDLAVNLGKTKCLEPLLTYGAELEDLEGLAIPELALEIARYFIKRSEAGLSLSGNARKMIAKESAQLEEHRRRCADEVSRMKSTYLYEQLSYFNFLHGTKRILVLCASIADVCMSFQNSLSRKMLHLHFPMYADMLERNFVVGMHCRPFYDGAVRGLGALSGFALPILPIERILSFLEVKDMRNLAEFQSGP